ncbi:MAG: hypothetical protein FWG17_02705 [Desulfovibrionaceae bacterium]|nr:hypothetical protein [Desulfovibrionaceae bacterium]
MESISLTQVQVLYLEALQDGPKDTGTLMKIVRDRLSALKSGTTPVGATARAQGVLEELENFEYIVKTKSSLFGGKTFGLTDKGKEAIAVEKK